jgi:deazaflavin-dependent oxidoreductase (nitroreductase family)
MTKTEFNNWNRQIIEEFRANKGKVGGPFEGAPMLLLTTTGAKSGKQHTTPLVYLPDNDRFIIFASKAGAPTNPDWYHNLVAHPQVTIEVGTETLDVTAVVVNSEERDRLFNKQAEISPGFADYQAKTTRQIPVIALQR